jgi:hypothetical protein
MSIANVRNGRKADVAGSTQEWIEIDAIVERLAAGSRPTYVRDFVYGEIPMRIDDPGLPIILA